MVKNNFLEAEGMHITVFNKNCTDYFSLTDMVNDSKEIQNWMRMPKTIEFLEAWEQIHNENFKPLHLEGFKKQGEYKRLYMSPKKWVKETNAIGIMSKSGRYGGTYAHKDIALEFATWLSPKFKVFLLKDYQRLKNLENNPHTLEWEVKRNIAKTNYKLHTDSIKENLIDQSVNLDNNAHFEYMAEADMLNKIVWGMTAKQWRMNNPELAVKSGNMRDYGSINELRVLANLEALNALFMRQGVNRASRIKMLTKDAIVQFNSFKDVDHLRDLKKLNLQKKIKELNK